MALDAKEQRRKLLEEVRKRRLQNAQNRLKHQQSAYDNNSDYREYQEQLNEEARVYR